MWCVMSKNLIKRKVVWMSAGVSSFIAGYLVRDTVTDWIYIDIKDQHPDSIRFIKDCEKKIGKEVEILRSTKYSSVEEVVLDTGVVNTPYGAACTGMLKKNVRKHWENEHLGEELTYVWGMDRTETKRAERLRENFPEFQHEFPLIERNLTKEDCHSLLREIGIKRPVMYENFRNNNCIGCVKGGMGYWNKIRRLYPEVFEARAKMERKVGHSCLNGIFLDELPEDAGRNDEIMDECSIFCLVASKEVA